jgi:hypothetical protein
VRARDEQADAGVDETATCSEFAGCASNDIYAATSTRTNSTRLGRGGECGDICQILGAASRTLVRQQMLPIDEAHPDAIDDLFDFRVITCFESDSQMVFMTSSRSGGTPIRMILPGSMKTAGVS